MVWRATGSGAGSLEDPGRPGTGPAPELAGPELPPGSGSGHTLGTATGVAVAGLSKSMLFCAFFLPCLLVCSCLLSYLLWRSLNTLNTHHHDTQNWREPHHRILIINGCCSENFIENSNFLKDSDSDQSLVKPNKYSRYLYPNNWKAQPQNRNLQPETQAWNRKPLWAHSRRLQQPP